MTAPDAGEVFLTAEDGGRIAVSVLRPLEHGGDEHPVVVLAHGWGGGRRIWSLVTDRLLRGGFPVVAYDLRGHGASTVGSSGVTAQAMTADLATVLSYAGDAPIVVGHLGRVRGAGTGGRVRAGQPARWAWCWSPRPRTTRTRRRRRPP